MGYYIDLNQISIEQYQRILESADLLPSRLVLKENLKDNFDRLKNQGINHVEELLKTLGSKKKIQDLSKECQVDENYLTILAREAKSYRQKPNNLKDFPDTSSELVAKLEEIGIKNTLKLYDRILTEMDRRQLAVELKVDLAEIQRLAGLTDLSRIRWVNHTFAYVLYEAGYQTAERVAHADYKELHKDVKQLNEERQIYKAHIGLHDMKLCVESARELPLDVE